MHKYQQNQGCRATTRMKTEITLVDTYIRNIYVKYISKSITWRASSEGFLITKYRHMQSIYMLKENIYSQLNYATHIFISSLVAKALGLNLVKKIRQLS